MGCPGGCYTGLGRGEIGCGVHPGPPLKALDQRPKLRAVTLGYFYLQVMELDLFLLEEQSVLDMVVLVRPESTSCLSSTHNMLRLPGATW